MLLVFACVLALALAGAGRKRGEVHEHEWPDQLTDDKTMTLVPQYVKMPRVAPVDPRNELRIENFKIGPWQLTPGGSFEGVNVVLPRPEVNELIEVAHFGNFVPVFANESVVPREQFYLHHILAYDQTNGHFVAGCSNERSNWGPDNLPYPYRMILQPHATVKAQGFHMVNLKPWGTFDFYITYTVMYKVHNPVDPPVRVVESFYWMDNFNVPGGAARNSTFERARSMTFPRDMIVVSMNGHLHQGGKRLSVKFDDPTRSPNEICTTYNLYKSDYKCFWDCEICPYANDWAAQWEMTTCYMELPVRRNEKVTSIAEYDNSCGWRGVMAWWFSFGYAGEDLPAKPAASNQAQPMQPIASK